MNVCCDAMAEVLHERDRLITNDKSGNMLVYRVNYRDGGWRHICYCPFCGKRLD